jgi:predicted CxxxxCH...CXXCH cytochrome family protein
MARNRRRFVVLAASLAVGICLACTEVRQEAFGPATDTVATDVPAGEIDAVDPACVGCHGSDQSAAPPLDLKGHADPSNRGVGAHKAHLKGNSLGHDVACADCHVVPATVDEAGHLDTAWPAEVTFSGVAVADGATPALQAAQGPGATVTCSSVYCHGATLAGGTLTAPAWNPPDEAATACTSCHGFPPPAPHPAMSQCERCHAPVVSAGGVITDRSLHIDGKVDVLTFSDCSACHGSDESPAPPVDLAGGSEPTEPGVGAHQSHLKAAHGLSAPVTCDQCHEVPASVNAPGHLDDGTPGADLSFGALATDDGEVAAAYDREARTCANTYCHGATLPGGGLTTPVWNVVDDTQATCGACHGVPPPAPDHPQSHECGQCHPSTAVGMTIAHPEKHIDGTLDVAGTLACNGCHGNEQNYAPPFDTHGGSATTLVTVGAHQPHLLASSGLSSPVACTECHVVPASVDAPSHLGSAPAELTFGTLATAGGVAPQFDEATGACSSTYCHGATLPGGSNTAPVWTKVDDTQDACGACHGVPPPAPHPQVTDCGMCHVDTAVGGAIAHPEKHIDGVLQVGTGLACNSCHGSTDNPAPPEDTQGGTTTTLVTVGAHQSHVTAKGGLSLPLQCTDCHVQPAAVGDAGHLDAAPAEVQFGALASAGGADPLWDRDTATCSSTYCHGVTLPGGSDPHPTWTVVDGSQEACGACHGVPPPAPHVQLTSCGVCHSATAVGMAIAHPEKHVNGQLEVDLDLSCSACHGGDDNPAPPNDTTGGTSTTLVTVGAHQPHLTAASGLASPLACTDCHVQPATVGQTGHLGEPPAEVEFGALASAHGAEPQWDRATATCSSTYCHGATLSAGGADTAPVWTTVDGTEDACGACHGVPPPAPHVQIANCGECHTATAVGTTIAHPEKHIDGTLQVNTSLACNTCHGSADNPAPPVDTNGGTSTALLTVGAHQSHVAPADGLAAPIDCAACHVKPAHMGDDGHLGPPPAELSFHGVALDDGANPAWDRGTATCSTTYCHGATLNAGGADTEPVWTEVDGSHKACDACHGNPPPAPHVQMTDCGLCHPATAEGDAIAHPEHHVDGTLDVDLAQGCSACHGSVDNPAPPVDTAGGSSTSLVTVGAHQAHVTAAGGLSAAIACDQCHVMPQSVDAPTHLGPAPAEVAFGDLAAADGAVPAWDRDNGTCSSTYCHGATLNAGGSVTTPVWTKVDGTQEACGACHGNPPPAPHLQLANCGGCHGATASGGAIAHPEHHVDGVLDVNVNQSCSTCHGSTDNAAPPVDTQGQSSTDHASVGAHQAHLKALSGLSAPVACGTCHVVPATGDAAGHLDAAPAEVLLTGLAASGGASPAFSHGTATCSATYCHGATLDAGGTATTPTWTKVDGTQDTCGACHGNPPPAPHAQNANCGACHPATASGGSIAHPEHHIDGTLDYDPSQAGCSTCHGNADNAAPPTDTNGGSATTLITVGAHQAHLTAPSGLSAPVACGTCHTVPATPGAAGHIDASPAEVAMTGLAAANGAAPTFSHAAATCSSTYCHGATLDAGGTVTTPKWTKVDGTEDACGACHGNPPPAPHVQLTNCGQCHTATASGNAIAHPEKHIDGIVQFDAAQGCSSCHGNATNAAPPKDTNGGTATTLTTVGAHQAHLLASSGLSAPVACSTCHAVPGSVDAAGHLDASPAEVAMTGLAAANGAAPTFSHAAATCSSTYCHGATLNAGGTATTPLWTKVDGTQDACGACHGNPPPLPHAQVSRCGLCHTETAEGGAIAHPEKHIDGVVQTATSQACNDCHGSAVNDAPPVDLDGASSTTLVSVGAHQSHLLASSGLASPVACTTCHVVPGALSSPGHLDASPAEVSMSGLAANGGASPAFNHASATCSSTYCHGATLNAGGTATTPLWTKVDGTQDACGACHGNPPPAPHVTMGNCGLCHGATATNGTIAHPEKHINGTLDVSLPSACNACHGSGTNDAPPADVNGGTATSLKSVGAHQAHLLASSALSSPVACTECHKVPATVTASGHLDASPAELTFGTLAKTGGAAATWNASAGTCSGTYCHGATLSSGTLKTPLWTKVDNTQDACGTCHGRPATGQHGEHGQTNCRECHNTVATTTAITGPALHINGQKDVSLRSGGTWSSTTKSCDPACHDSENWY